MYTESQVDPAKKINDHERVLTDVVTNGQKRLGCKFRKACHDHMSNQELVKVLRTLISPPEYGHQIRKVPAEVHVNVKSSHNKGSSRAR